MSDHLYRSASHVSRTLWPEASDVHEDGRFNVGRHSNSFFQKHLLHSKSSPKEETKHNDGRSNRPLARLRVRHHDYGFRPPIEDFKGQPRMNIAILIVGSRGDVQPFIALGKTLQAAPYRHRVRICTHPNFKGFVEENGLEFFSIGGDPEKLMSYMVRNPGIVPSLASWRAGDVGARRHEIEEMLHGCWRACTEAGNGIDPVQIQHRDYEKGHEEDVFHDLQAPFIADAIISNPPAYANIHIAEKLGIPLHMMFTMPWSPTTAFSHPLANVDQNRTDVKFANFMSYYHVELLTWEGLVDLINKFREKTLFLDAIDPAWGYILMPHLKVPFTYFWSPALIPKPPDWGSHITISGFQFLSLASSFTPPPELQAFLDAGPPPVYIGFGSIVVDDPDKLSSMVLEAVQQSGVRALVSKGWGNLGGHDIPDNVFLLGNVPHDWLFPRCSAVVHHGGAGTTAIGIALGKPTVIVPFFGDQPWWGNMVYRAGTGPEPVPYKNLTADKLADTLRKVLEPDVQERAHELSSKISNENGAETAAQQFHATPQMQNLGCFLFPDRVAVWRIKRTNIRLSALAAAILVVNGRVKTHNLKLVRHKIWTVEEGAQDPFVALIAIVTTTLIGYVGDGRQFTQDLSEARSRTTILEAGTSNPARRSTLKAKATATLACSIAARTAKIPLNLVYNLANGFHNAPAHLLGDPTVRVRGHITGLPSGLATAITGGANELLDGVTGLYTHPARAVRRTRGRGPGSKTLGVARGVGQGVGGLVLKICAAAVGVPGYTLKGAEREVERWLAGADESDQASREYMARAREWMGKERRARRGEKADEGVGEQQGVDVKWVKRRGPAAMRRVTERRAWQSLSELHGLEVESGIKAAELEGEVLRLWDGMHVPGRFV